MTRLLLHLLVCLIMLAFNYIRIDGFIHMCPNHTMMIIGNELVPIYLVFLASFRMHFHFHFFFFRLAKSSVSHLLVSTVTFHMNFSFEVSLILSAISAFHSMICVLSCPIQLSKVQSDFDVPMLHEILRKSKTRHTCQLHFITLLLFRFHSNSTYGPICIFLPGLVYISRDIAS